MFNDLEGGPETKYMNTIFMQFFAWKAFLFYLLSL